MPRLGVVIRSLKNRRRHVLVRGRIIPIPSKEALTDRALVRSIVAKAPLPPERDVRLELWWLVEQDAIEWAVIDLGPRNPKKRKGRSDLQGIVEALCDALQGYSFENDSQVAEIRAAKVYG